MAEKPREQQETDADRLKQHEPPEAEAGDDDFDDDLDDDLDDEVDDEVDDAEDDEQPV
jgi:hypothetical protein